MNYQDRKDYIVQVESEVIRACNKHDRVCDVFVGPNKKMSEIVTATTRRKNSSVQPSAVSSPRN